MGKSWDKSGIAFNTEVWSECLRVLKPGGHMLAFGGCYDNETEILTEKGWKYFNEVTKDDFVATLNPENEEIIYQQPLEIVKYDNYKKLYHFKTNKIDLMVTPNHKMFVKYLGGYKNSKWKLTRADEVKNAIKMKKNGVWTGDDVEYFILPKTTQSNGHKIKEISEMKIPMDTWLKFLGLWIAEGSSTITKIKTGFDYNTQICHFNNENLDELEKELSPYFNICRYKEHGKFRINNKQLAEYLQPYCYSWLKHIPEEIKKLSSRQLEILLDWYMRGDSDGRRCYTCSKKLVDDLQEIALKIGLSADYTVCKEKQRKINNREITQKHKQYAVSINFKQNEPEVYQRKGKKPVVKIVDYDDFVYCVEVPLYHTLYVRRNGKTSWCGNTRTFHRIAVAIEDAGFELRDTVMWVYGCLSEDTEILTENGWKNKNTITTNDIVFSMDLKKHKIVKSNINHIFEYEYNGKIINLKNADTDQLITPNHKVINKKGSRKQKSGKRHWYNEEDWVYRDAWQLTSDYYTLPLASTYDGNYSIGGDMAELIGWIISEGNFQKDCNAINIYQSSVNKDNVKRIRYCLNRLGIKYSEYQKNRIYKNRSYIEYQWYISGEYVDIIKEIIPNKLPTLRLLDLKLSEKERLITGLCRGDGSVDDNGKYITFYQNNIETLEWFQILMHLTGKQGKINKNNMSCSINYSDSTQIQRKHNKNRQISYNGIVWCINTDIGNFMARRNGKIFFTGNSGFPKSHDVSKGIDKINGEIGRLLKFVKWMRTTGLTANQINTIINKSDIGSHYLRLDQPAIPTSDLWEKLRPHIEVEIPKWVDALVERIEAERKVIGSVTKARSTSGKSALPTTDGKTVYETWHTTAPATPEAQMWEGWGTALKPAFEPIILAKKPISEKNIAENVLKWGTGGINIDDCRVDGSGYTTGGQNRTVAFGSSGLGDKQPRNDGSNGRWPANFIHDGSEEVLRLFPKTKPSVRNKLSDNRQNMNKSMFIDGRRGPENSYDDSGSAARFFYCAKASRKERGESNNHPTVKPIKLMEYLVKLITPPNGIVLDPFQGSGSTQLQCIVNNVNYVLIELNKEYVEIQEKRIQEYKNNSIQQKLFEE